MNGVDHFLKNQGVLGSGCVLICSSSAVDSRGQAVYRAVQQKIGPRLKAIWSLQHGFFIDKQDNMILSDSFNHPELNIPIYSLYGEQLTPQMEWLEGIDTLIIDILDVGTRVYTFTNHLVKIARALSGRPIRWLILDRPNPLGGVDLEGPILDSAYRSIVGEIKVPMRHGLSAAEYVVLAIKRESLDIDYSLYLAEGWQRTDHSQGIWTLPSPNMPSWLTAHLYPGAVLLEGTNLSEGRGTTRPFELLGGPFIDAQALAKNLNTRPDLGVLAIPMHFKPEFSKFKGQVCQGVLCHQPQPQKTRSFAFFYELIRWVRHHHVDEFAWKEPPYEFEYERPPIDMICGSPSFRLAIEANMPLADWLAESESGFTDYRADIRDHLLY